MAKYGSKGSKVRALQHALGLLIDGSFGGNTKNAVVAFQMDNRLPGSGIADDKTWAALLPKLRQREAVPASRAVFFGELRKTLFRNGIKQNQVNGINRLLDVLENSRIGVNHAAYMLATAYHETAGTMQPIEEYGKGKGCDYGRRLKMNRQPYSAALPIYYGRGYVQLTWYENYEKAGRKLGLDLLRNPDLALLPDHAAAIMIFGMAEGWFTGKKLTDYIGEHAANYVGARRIINGNDKAGEIAFVAVAFELALRRAK
ncbi:peptidoglycan-binding protein [Neisseria musculi]|uniref:Chitinase class I family protein n=1 Tax=Neisseria musculi TaxID=1815583 RepID=A0A7H1M8S3_9NEIS|nr:peptidoglycan-binding protein [Neisseria musculi]QNT58038.1 putative peptidoglycan binding domain protein [Neisseria musculi]